MLLRMGLIHQGAMCRCRFSRTATFPVCPLTAARVSPERR